LTVEERPGDLLEDEPRLVGWTRDDLDPVDREDDFLSPGFTCCGLAVRSLAGLLRPPVQIREPLLRGSTERIVLRF
jgi:hypothetical protein